MTGEGLGKTTTGQDGWDSDVIEAIPSEQADSDASLPTYEILTYPADYTLEVLVDKWRKKQIITPGFQRHFVWDQKQASRLIDSFLKGLPVPSIFLFSGLNRPELLVVDGQQRLKTIVYFFDGFFGEALHGKRRVFNLTGLEEGSRYEGLDYKALENRDPTGFAKLNNSVLRAFVMRQLDPADDTSMYHIFERLNTGGTLLRPQEIRNCVYHGRFNDMLIRANEFDAWRLIFGRTMVDKRQRDVELILRFLAFVEASSSYRRPLKNFLNLYMDSKKNESPQEIEGLDRLFKRTASVVARELGPRPFHIRAGLNTAVFDSVFVAIANRLDNLSEDLQSKYKELILNEEFLDLTKSRTTNEEVVTRRMRLASEALR